MIKLNPKEKILFDNAVEDIFKAYTESEDFKSKEWCAEQLDAEIRQSEINELTEDFLDFILEKSFGIFKIN